MALPADLVRFTFETELARAQSRAAIFGFKLEGNVDALTIRIEFINPEGEQFILVGEFDNYKAQPPLLEFVEPSTGVRGTARAYPKSTDSFFHTQPIICAPFNRKAYQEVHRDWDLAGWTTSRANGIDWSPYSTMSGMLVLVHNRITHPLLHVPGRMGT